MDHQPVVFTNALLLCPAQVGKFLSFIIFVINVFEREGKGMKGKISLDSFSTPGSLLCSSSPTLEKGSSWIPTLPSKGQGNLASGWPICMLVSGFCSGVHEVNKLASKRGSADLRGNFLCFLHPCSLACWNQVKPGPLELFYFF